MMLWCYKQVVFSRIMCTMLDLTLLVSWTMLSNCLPSNYFHLLESTVKTFGFCYRMWMLRVQYFIMQHCASKILLNTSTKLYFSLYTSKFLELYCLIFPHFLMEVSFHPFCQYVLPSSGFWHSHLILTQFKKILRLV